MKEGQAQAHLSDTDVFVVRHTHTQAGIPGVASESPKAGKRYRAKFRCSRYIRVEPIRIPMWRLKHGVAASLQTTASDVVNGTVPKNPRISPIRKYCVFIRPPPESKPVARTRCHPLGDPTEGSQ